MPDSKRRPLSLAGLASITGVCLLVLLVLRRCLRLPSGFDIEDFLGWRQPELVKAVWDLWYSGNHGGWVAAGAYLLIDLGLFIPCYVVLLLTLYHRTFMPLRTGRSRLGGLCRAILILGSCLLLPALVIVDVLENYGGILRLGLPGLAFWLALSALPLVMLDLAGLREQWPGLRPVTWLRRGLGAVARIVTRLSVAAWLAGLPLMAGLGRVAGALRRALDWTAGLPVVVPMVPLVLAIALVQAARRMWEPGADGSGIFEPSVAWIWAHAAKSTLAGGQVGILLLGLGVWWYGLAFDYRTQTAERRAMAELRAAVRGIIVRSRYVLLTIGVFAGLLLLQDQARDVTLALADFSSGEHPVWRVIVLVLSALAVAMLAHSCWLWTRLACMVRRAGADDSTTALHPLAYAFARAWARLLATLPLASVCLLVALALGDAALAVRRINDNWTQWALTMVVLALFAGAAVLFGLYLIRLRRRARLASDAKYFDAVDDVRMLLAGIAPTGVDDTGPAHAAWLVRARARVAALIQRLAQPTWLPVIALSLMMSLRLAAWLLPQASAAVPAGLVLMTLGLVWWLGVLGVLSLYESNRGLPFILLPLAVAGLLTAFDWADNERLFQEMTLDFSEALPADLNSLQSDGVLALGVLAAACLIAWAATLAPDRWLASASMPRLVRRLPTPTRWAVALLGAGMAITVLHGLDRNARAIWCEAAQPGTSRQAPACGVAATSTPPSTVALSKQPEAGAIPRADAVSRTSPLSPLSPSTLEPSLLVAAEGGGTRSAYWTARALVELTATEPRFVQRTFLLSGVSGGSMGIAVYRACLLKLAHGDADKAGKATGPDEPAFVPALRDCVVDHFTAVDALTPLLGGLLFEDVVARLLPTRWFCSLPGCGHLSRGLLFERAWTRSLPELAVPLARLGEDRGQQVAFNATWVESGNRTVASSWRPGNGAIAMPSAIRLQDCLSFEPALITAAHASARFPYINPLASVQPSEPLDAGDKAGCRQAGYLIDGGYFDNSATTTLNDALRHLRHHSPDRPVKLILIRNGVSEPECQLDGDEAGDQGSREPRPDCFRLANEVRTDPSKLERPMDRRRWNFYAAELSALTTLLNVSGIGAHGREATAQLISVVRGDARNSASYGSGVIGSRPVVLIEQIDDGELVPLGWHLSGPARQSLENQLKLVFDSLGAESAE